VIGRRLIQRPGVETSLEIVEQGHQKVWASFPGFGLWHQLILIWQNVTPIGSPVAVTVAIGLKATRRVWLNPFRPEVQFYPGFNSRNC